MSNPETMRVVLVDDEPLALRGLELRLSPFSGIEISAACSTGRQALEAVERCEPQVLFLDINMPNMDGFAVLEALRETEREDVPLVVFVTAFDTYAVEAFEANAFDYVLKPVDETRLAAVIDRVRRRLRQQSQARYGERIQSLLTTLDGWPEKERSEAVIRSLNNMETGYPAVLSIRDRGRVARVPVADIDWVEAERDYMCIHTSGQTYLMRETMTRLEERLNPAQFSRVHRSALVNLAKIRELRSGEQGGMSLLLRNGVEIPVGRSYRRKIADRFEHRL
ncbi:MAG: LytR/AlgR family response regulator transcription factor [Alphaproteobacteria bacterium]